MHDLKESKGKVWTTRCGMESSAANGDTTAWPSKVTCSACLATRLHPPARRRTIKRRKVLV